MASLSPSGLVQLHNNNAVFNFCGAMLFQLRLTTALRARLQENKMTSLPAAQPPCKKMSDLPGYKTTASADDVTFFHGREVRNVKDDAAGL